jgi:hypothetical protein
MDDQDLEQHQTPYVIILLAYPDFRFESFLRIFELHLLLDFL